MSFHKFELLLDSMFPLVIVPSTDIRPLSSNGASFVTTRSLRKFVSLFSISPTILREMANLMPWVNRSRVASRSRKRLTRYVHDANRVTVVLIVRLSDQMNLFAVSDEAPVIFDAHHIRWQMNINLVWRRLNIIIK